MEFLFGNDFVKRCLFYMYSEDYTKYLLSQTDNYTLGVYSYLDVFSKLEFYPKDYLGYLPYNGKFICPFCGRQISVTEPSMTGSEYRHSDECSKSYRYQNKQEIVKLSKILYKEKIRFIREFPYVNFYQRECKNLHYDLFEVNPDNIMKMCNRADYLCLYNNHLFIIEYDEEYHKTKPERLDKDSYNNEEILKRFGIPIIRINQSNAAHDIHEFLSKYKCIGYTPHPYKNTKYGIYFEFMLDGLQIMYNRLAYWVHRNEGCGSDMLEYIGKLKNRYNNLLNDDYDFNHQIEQEYIEYLHKLEDKVGYGYGH